jgi:hypothetical protein
MCNSAESFAVVESLLLLFSLSVEYLFVACLLRSLIRDASLAVSCCLFLSLLSMCYISLNRF